MAADQCWSYAYLILQEKRTHQFAWCGVHDVLDLHIEPLNETTERLNGGLRG